MTVEFISESLTPFHNTDEFDCGVPVLNSWLWDQALVAQKHGTARTTVWKGVEGGRVVAYYSVAPTQIARADLTNPLVGGHSIVPGFILARLALDRSLHGQGYGSELLVDALETICSASDLAGGRVIVVDPIDANARDFYLHLEFTPIERNQRERLYMLVKDARESIGLAHDS